MTTPVPLVLDLWALGHSAGDIVGRLDLPNVKHVERVVRNARSIRDPRAVLHADSNGRLIGRAAYSSVLAAVEVVPSIVALRLPVEKGSPGRPVSLICKNGHPRAGNVIDRSCKTCRQLRDKDRKR